MRFRLHDNSVLIFLLVGYFSVILGAIGILGVTIAEFLRDGSSVGMVFANGFSVAAAGYILFWIYKEWNYYFAAVSINNDGVKLSNKAKSLFEGNWSEITDIYFFAHVIWGGEVITMFFSKGSTTIEPKDLRKRWKMSTECFHTSIDATKIQEVLKYCPKEKIVWVLDKDCPRERFEKYEIYYFQYKV